MTKKKENEISPTFVAKYDGIAPSSTEARCLQVHTQTYVRECKNCGKTFDMYPSREDSWCYKIRVGLKFNMYCSYSCQVKAEKNGVGAKQWGKEKYSDEY